MEPITPQTVALIGAVVLGVTNALGDILTMPKIVKQLIAWGIALTLAAFVYYFPAVFNGFVATGLAIGMGATGLVGAGNRMASKVGTAVDLTKKESK